PHMRHTLSLHDALPILKSYLKNAEVVSVAPPNTREAELVAQRVDIIITDFPTAVKVTDEFDWAVTIQPNEKLAITPYAYVVPQGDRKSTRLNSSHRTIS